MSVESFSIKFTRQGLDYLRGVLGARPYDEVAPFLASIELQRREQEQPEPAKEPTPAPAPVPAKVTPLRAVRRGRPPKQTPAPSDAGTAVGLPT